MNAGRQYKSRTTYPGYWSGSCMCMSAVREDQRKKNMRRWWPWMYADGWHRPFPIEPRSLALRFRTPGSQATSNKLPFVACSPPLSPALHTVPFMSPIDGCPCWVRECWRHDAIILRQHRRSQVANTNVGPSVQFFLKQVLLGKHV